MPDLPKIPFGYRQVHGQSQQGDGVWDSQAKRFRKVRKGWPFAGDTGLLIIRKCEQVQTEIAGADGVEVMEI